MPPKLPGLGIPLAAEFLKNIGYDVAKQIDISIVLWVHLGGSNSVIGRIAEERGRQLQRK